MFQAWTVKRVESAIIRLCLADWQIKHIYLELADTVSEISSTRASQIIASSYHPAKLWLILNKVIECCIIISDYVITIYFVTFFTVYRDFLSEILQYSNNYLKINFL